MKLVHWSGAARVGGPLFDRARQILNEDEDGKDDDDDDDNDNVDIMDDEDDNIEDYRLSSGPDNPKSVAEIFECAGTLVMFSAASR